MLDAVAYRWTLLGAVGRCMPPFQLPCTPLPNVGVSVLVSEAVSLAMGGSVGHTTVAVSNQHDDDGCHCWVLAITVPVWVIL